MTTSGLSLLAAESRPAGGADLGEVVLATALGLGLTAVLLGLVWGHRTGRTTVLQRAGDRLGASSGSPGWVVLPALVATLSLLTALLGMLWDIALHIADGRDEGPLANPAHFLILFGLFGVFAAGVLACAMPLGVKPGPAAVRLTRGWHVPVGGVLLTATGLFALLGFPLDDVWHRLFGQDVTLWGPTHLMLIGGAGFSLIGLLVLEHEGHGALETGVGDRKVGRRMRVVRQASAFGGLLLGLSVFQGEFDFGVPQFRAVFEPFMIAAAAGVALVAARLVIGKGGALAAAVFFLVVRGTIALVVGVGFDELTPTFPLYLGSAILVELVALALARRPVAFGAVAGVLIGTAGTLIEYAWSQVTSPLPWTGDIVVEGTLMAVVGGVAGGVLGALLALGLQRRLPAPRVAATAYVASLLALGVCVANGLIATVPDGARASFAVDDVGTGEQRTADITVRLEPADLVDSPSWVQITAWQGQGLVVQELEQSGPGEYRTTEPVPLHGTWKTLLRVHDGRMLTAAPIYLPEDPVIGEEEVPAQDGMTRELIPEVEILQRELDHDAPMWLWNAASALVLVSFLAIFAALGWGVGRFARSGGAGAVYPDTPATAPVPSGAGSR
jgi:hypothetical protein